MDHQQFNVVQVGKSGFPIDMAADMERMRLLGKGLVDHGIGVMVLNRKGIMEPELALDHIPLEGEIDGVHYQYLSGTIYRPDSFWQRNKNKIIGLLNEYRTLGQLKRKHQCDFLLVHSMDFPDMLWYKIMAWRWKMKLIFQIVEWNSSMTSRKGFKTKISDRLQEAIGLRFADAFLPISNYLAELLQKRFPQKPQLKVPVICDFSSFDAVPKQSSEPYMLYCGSLGYAEVVHFILEAYARLDRPPLKLYLVLGGDSSSEGINAVKAYAKKLGIADSIRVFSRIPFSELIEKYCGAKGLLIPLRDSLQDKARFPHKIGEYLASGNPILTTNYGEVTHYFNHLETAFIAPEFELEAYSKLMQQLIDEPELGEKVGAAGRLLGLEQFDCNAHGRKLKAFLMPASKDSPSIEYDQQETLTVNQL